MESKMKPINTHYLALTFSVEGVTFFFSAHKKGEPKSNIIQLQLMLSTENLTFDQLPEAVVGLTREVASLRELIDSKLSATEDKDRENQWLSVDDLCNYLPDRPSKQTVYGWVNQRVIPYHKTTKRLSFLKSEIDAWINNGRRKTAKELRDEAVNTHGYKKGGLL